MKANASPGVRCFLYAWRNKLHLARNHYHEVQQIWGCVRIEGYGGGSDVAPMDAFGPQDEAESTRPGCWPPTSVWSGSVGGSGVALELAGWEGETSCKESSLSSSRGKPTMRTVCGTLGGC